MSKAQKVRSNYKIEPWTFYWFSLLICGPWNIEISNQLSNSCPHKCWWHYLTLFMIFLQNKSLILSIEQKFRLFQTGFFQLATKVNLVELLQLKCHIYHPWLWRHWRCHHNNIQNSLWILVGHMKFGEHQMQTY